MKNKKTVGLLVLLTSVLQVHAAQHVWHRFSRFVVPSSRVPVREFFRAVKDGDVATVERLFRRRLLDVRDAHGNTPLHHAKNIAIVRILLNAGADTEARNKAGRTPLHAAAIASPSGGEKVRLLLRHGAQIESRDNEGKSPLYRAIERIYDNSFNATISALDIVAAQALIEQGARIPQGIARNLIMTSRGLLGSNNMNAVVQELFETPNLPALRQALAYLDQEEHAHGTRVPTDLQNLIRDMVLTEEQRTRFEALR